MSEAVFGAGAGLHPITHMPLENGKGALPAEMQAQMHCDVIEQQQGKEAADEMREKLRAAATPEPESEIEPEQNQETEHGHEDDGRMGPDDAGGEEGASGG